MEGAVSWLRQLQVPEPSILAQRAAGLLSGPDSGYPRLLEPGVCHGLSVTGVARGTPDGSPVGVAARQKNYCPSRALGWAACGWRPRVTPLLPAFIFLVGFPAKQSRIGLCLPDESVPRPGP